MAYMLTVHNNADQLNKFIKEILTDRGGDTESEVFIHVDHRNRAMISDIIRDDRVHVYSKYESRWGSFQAIEAIEYLMDKVLEKGAKFTHIYYGTGADFPVRKGFLDYIEKNREDIFWSIDSGPTNPYGPEAALWEVRWNKWFMDGNNDHLVKRILRRAIIELYKKGICFHRNTKILPENIEVWHGSAYFTAPIELLEYFKRYLSENPGYKEFWKESIASDERFFQTIMMNSEYRSKRKDSIMYLRFGTGLKSNHPVYISVEDDEKIESGNYYFARKFDPENQDVYDYYINKLNS